jgi:hypothetical protein
VEERRPILTVLAWADTTAGALVVNRPQAMAPK